MGEKNVSLIGVPMWQGQSKYGVNWGPDVLRSVGLLDILKLSGNNIVDLGNIPVGIAGIYKQGTNIKNVKLVASANRRLADKVAEVVNNGDFPLVLGGDHSIAIGTIAGLGSHYKNMGVIWFDAHADINTPVTSPSGNIHGMPLAASLGLGHPELVDIGGFRGKIKSENIVMIGVRDIDEGERLFIEKEQIKNYTVEDIKRLGIKQVIQETVEYLSVRCDGIHLSFDIDGLDPTDMPGVGTPVTKGITYDDGLEIVKLLFAANILTSAEVVELNPLLDESGHTVRATVNLLGALFGVSEQVPLQQGRYVFQNNMTHS